MRLTLLGFCHVIACCISLIIVVDNYDVFLRLAGNDPDHLRAAALGVAPFALVSVAFAFSRFSFGYALGFYAYTLILGYLWLVNFSTFPYDHFKASVSAFASGVAFLAPALLITSPIKQRFALTPEMFRRLLSAILIAAAAVVAMGMFYHFRLVGLEDIYQFRNELGFPKPLEYAMGMTSGTLLPFAFACFVWFDMRLRAALCLLLLVLFWPITLSKVSLFAPAWLMFLAALTRFFEVRTAVMVSLLLPLLVGIAAAALNAFHLLPHQAFIAYFGSANFRAFALTSSAMDFYNGFFSSHDVTHFCHIGIINRLVACPYQDQLSVVMQNTYHIGYFNASMFATEGIASLGMTWAPLSALGCGLLFGFANRVSAGLPAKLVFLSGGVLLNILMNVPLSVALASHGALLLLLLWYVTPRSLFAERDVDLEPKASVSRHS